MSLPNEFVSRLARTLAAGTWSEEALLSRAARGLRKRYRFLRPLVQRVLDCFPGPMRPAVRELVTMLAQDLRLERAYDRLAETDEPLTLRPLRRDEYVPPPWLPVGLPDIPTVGALAQYLGVSPARLDWYADEHRSSSRRGPGAWHHYTYRWAPKRAGGTRLIEAPKPRLKALQQQLLFGILDHVPTHNAAHAYCQGRSTRTYVAPHCGAHVVLKLDLRNFFGSIRQGQVAAIFRAIGYPEQVVLRLARLCTSAVPIAMMDQPQRLPERERQALRHFHLPQGAPTSPALANLCAYALDCRLSGLAASAGAVYSRYADDLLFSGDETFARGVQRFAIAAAVIAAEEGWQLQHRKTRIMRQSVRQHAVGLVINERPNIDRRDFDRLKAILTNCLRHGARSQNREEHPHFREQLTSRVAYVAQIHPQRGEKLRRLLAEIVWE